MPNDQAVQNHPVHVNASGTLLLSLDSYRKQSGDEGGLFLKSKEHSALLTAVKHRGHFARGCLSNQAFTVASERPAAVGNTCPWHFYLGLRVHFLLGPVYG